jgi:C4-dicarboxylate-specific signal transduction histidine kinase
VEVETQGKEGEVVVSVRDHGGGIAPDKFGTLFKPFQTTKPSGLGMGLAICRRLVEAHEGHIEATNHPNGGAVFTFSLPIASGPRPG